MDLRPYQSEGVNAVLESFEKYRSVLVTMPTGTGKTVLFCDIISKILHAKGGRAMILAHREELVDQAADKVFKVTGYRPQVEMADRWANEKTGIPARVIVSSIQTQATGRLKRFDPRDFSIIIVDEAHHATSRTWKSTIDYYLQGNPDLKVLGVTATPDRSDKKAMGRVFEHVAYNFEILDAIRGGWLVPIKQLSVFVKGLDLSKIRKVAGDFNQKQLADIMEEEGPIHSVAGPTMELTQGRKTLLFAVTVNHAKLLAAILNRREPGCAEVVTGKTPKNERRDLLRRFARGDFRIMVNVGVFTEGFDEPSIQCVVLARPTQSRSLYAQMVGRGTRPLEGVLQGADDAAGRRAAISSSGKPRLDVIDLVGNAGRHKLVSTVDILGGEYSDEVRERAKQRLNQDPDADVMEVLEQADSEVQRELLLKQQRESEARRHINPDVLYGVKAVDPFDVLGIKPSKAPNWMDNVHHASAKQIELLKREGVPIEGRLSKGKANQLISEIFNRREQKKPSFRLARTLSIHGIDPAGMTEKQAVAKVLELASKGWKA